MSIDQRPILVGDSAAVGDEARLRERDLHRRIVGFFAHRRAERGHCAGRIVEPHQRVAEQIPALEIVRRRGNARAQTHHEIAERGRIRFRLAQHFR